MQSESCNLKIGERPELRNLKLLYGIYSFLIVSLIVMPQYFGVHLGYDITCTRAADLLLTIYMLICPMMLTLVWKTSLRCPAFYPLVFYVAVAGYTMVFRKDINAFFLVFLEVYNFLLLIYGIRYVIGYKKALKLIEGCAWFLAVYGIIEYLYGHSLFLQFMATVPTNVKNAYRSGHYRIMGPCGHSLGYGLLLLLFVAVISYDAEKDEIYLFRRPFLLLLLLINVFLTGSRSTLGIVAMECCLIILSSRGITLKKSLMFSGILLVSGAAILLLIQGTDIGRFFTGQLMSIVDHVFGTSYAEAYGIDSTTLENSANYRKVLPYIFTVDWLNPIVGRGNRFSGIELRGVYVHSIDNYYVSQYIKYAYPGLVSYVLFLLTVLTGLVYNIIKFKSGLAKMVLIGVGCYFFNLWWLDALQTLKFIYLILAVYYAYCMERKDIAKRKDSEIKESVT